MILPKCLAKAMCLFKIPNFFEGKYKVLFLSPQLWSCLKGMRHLANFKKDYNLDYYDFVFWNVHMESIEHYVTAVHEPHTGADIRYSSDALGKRMSEKKKHFHENVHDLIEVMNIFGNFYKRQWGDGPLPDFQEILTQRGNDCGLVANQIALYIYQGLPVGSMDMDSALMRITQAAVVWDATRSKVVSL